MTKEEWEAIGVQTYGLPTDLEVPIASASIEAIETYVGAIEKLIPGRKRPINAVVVVARQPCRSPSVSLWNQGNADQYYGVLHPPRQLWVHVDYTGYRTAWNRLGFGDLTPDIFLDHIKNREAVRIRGYQHPFLRLCPISRASNTSSGLDSGAEGIEKNEMRNLKQKPAAVRREIERRLNAPMVLADPADLTKMLDIPTGLSELQGVAGMLKKFYPKDG